MVVGRNYKINDYGHCINENCELFKDYTENHYCTFCGSRTTVPNRTTGKVEPKIKEVNHE